MNRLPYRAAVMSVLVTAVATSCLAQVTANFEPLFEDSAQHDVLYFLNGDRIHGMLLSIKAEEHGLLWRSESILTPAQMAQGALSDVRLAKRRARSPRKIHTCAVRLTNDDVLLGDLVSLDSESLRLDTWYAGEIAVARRMMAAIEPLVEAPSLIYSGPGNLSEWTFQQNNDQPTWKFRQGALYALQHYPIGMTLKELPRKISFAFTAAWRGQPSLNFMFLAQDANNTSSDRYALQISGSSCYLYRYQRNSGSQNLGNANIMKFNTGTVRKADFLVLLDRDKGAIKLLLDGQMVGEWNDAAMGKSTGNAILFQPQSRSDLKLSKISIAKWSGKLPSDESVEGGANQDTIRFSNDDVISGTLQSISDGKMTFETSYATMSVPVERAKSIEFATAGAERARRRKGDVRAHFTDRGSLTVQLTHIERDEMHGKSDNLSDVSLPLEALSRIEFNIYTDRPEEEEEDF
ncbi:MAG: hypothetical protein O2923_08230 [Verrucomicrobia bacterium]|nr:hypothetical protein [Verrucomicrobiota bacterium]MDA1088081.1 hypothetical protein [Verrucomicrobiota bacterium]